ncbi:Two-component system response regulator [Pseudomonas syringae pv. pisi]|uniref:Two-component system response regulator n=3 Tax=Pseudomonas syringae TaxID=317 RepID=A0A3M3UL68_PSESJ|nr:Two-component system response regulator [Pseudomonas syringae pv. pisi]
MTGDFRILIIDDQRPNLDLMEQLLAREGLTNVLSSTEPLRTLDLFNSFEPDLVVLDLHMPEFDGFAVLEQLNRRIPTNDYLPIMVLTADATRDTRLRALALGARDFISKPLDALETMLRIWNLLETRALYKSLRELVPAENIELLRQRRARWRSSDYLISVTGTDASWITRVATEPSSKPPKLPSPRVPITTASQPSRLTSASTCSATLPRSTWA